MSEMIRVPTSVAEMLPPKASNITTEAANFIRTHIQEILPYLRAISGEDKSMHGSAMLDQAAYVFKVKEIAMANGFAFLGSVETEQLRRALRRGYKRNTGDAMYMLEAQRKRLQIEQKDQS